MSYFKVKLQLGYSSRTLWVAVQAQSEGEAVVIADNRSIETLFSICDNSVTEITKREYYIILSNSGRMPYLESEQPLSLLSTLIGNSLIASGVVVMNFFPKFQLILGYGFKCCTQPEQVAINRLELSCKNSLDTLLPFMTYFKVRLKDKNTSLEIWSIVQARSIGAAVVLADDRCLDTCMEM